MLVMLVVAGPSISLKQTTAMDLIHSLNDFFERHLLRWMDCLSILGKLEIAMDSLLKLKSWVGELVIVMWMSLKRVTVGTRPPGKESD